MSSLAVIPYMSLAQSQTDTNSTSEINTSKQCGKHNHGKKHKTMKKYGHHKKHLDEHLTRIKTELAISADQEEQWQEFVAAIKEARPSHKKMHSSQTTQDLQPNERLTQRIKKIEEHVVKLKALQVAMTTLISVLTPEQQEHSDLLLPRPRHRNN